MGYKLIENLPPNANFKQIWLEAYLPSTVFIHLCFPPTAAPFSYDVTTIKVQYISHENMLEESTQFQVWSKKSSWMGQKKMEGGLLLCFCPILYCSAGLGLLGKAFSLSPHVGHWPFVCNDVSPPSVWRVIPLLQSLCCHGNTLGGQWQQSYSRGKSEHKEEFN